MTQILEVKHLAHPIRRGSNLHRARAWLQTAPPSYSAILEKGGAGVRVSHETDTGVQKGSASEDKPLTDVGRRLGRGGGWPGTRPCGRGRA